jgi:hypothetical protein
LQFSEGDDIKLLEILDNQRRANKMLPIQLQSKTGTVPEQFKNRKKRFALSTAISNSSNLDLLLRTLVLMDTAHLNN